MGTAGLENNVFGFAKNSPFLNFTLEALRENYPRHSVVHSESEIHQLSYSTMTAFMAFLTFRCVCRT